MNSSRSKFRNDYCRIHLRKIIVNLLNRVIYSLYLMHLDSYKSFLSFRAISQRSVPKNQNPSDVQVLLLLLITSEIKLNNQLCHPSNNKRFKSFRR